MDLLDKYITTIFMIKICFIILVIIDLYYKLKGETNTVGYKDFTYLKERCEFIFIILMSILLIYIFNPKKAKLDLIDTEMTILFYLFGFVLVVSSKWSDFLTTSDWYTSNFK